MKRGQLFILSAFVIALSLGALINLSFFISSPVQKEKIMISSSKPIMQNLETELNYVPSSGPEVYVTPGDTTETFDNLRDFISIFQNYTEGKNFELEIKFKTGNASPPTCDMYAIAVDTIFPDFTNHTDYNISLRSFYDEELSYSHFIMCWKQE